jgi:DNA-binding transcriptional MocR family regulator
MAPWSAEPACRSPTFYAALQALERLHLKAVEVATDPKEGVDLGALAELLARQKVAACWFMPSFQNPLGALMPVARRQALVALLAQHGVPLIEDDVYGELHAGAPPPPARPSTSRAVRTARRFQMPGTRLPRGLGGGGRYAPQVSS